MIRSRLDFTPFDPNAKRHALFKDFSGRRFGRLVAQFPLGQKRYNYIWSCICDCGKTVEVLGARLASGKTQSCGCRKHERMLQMSRTHGRSKTKIYAVWCGMRSRCNNPNNKAFPYYGGRGIKLCERWNDYANFLADMGEAPDGLEIERKDNNGNYEPSNCIWATPTVQARNTRRNRFITAFGKTSCQSEWTEKTGLHGTTIHKRIKAGWSKERALTEPVGSIHLITAFGKTLRLSAWAAPSSINLGTLTKRLKLGWTPEKALTAAVDKRFSTRQPSPAIQQELSL